MTYNYKVENFLSVPTSDDLSIIVLDKDNNYVDSLTPDMSHYFVSNNCLVIKITNKNDLILSFESKLIAQQALEKLNTFRKEVLNNIPTITSGSSGISGTSGSSGISISGSSGESGTSGSSGISISGSSGTTGTSGSSGESGTSGSSGISGTSGSSGISISGSSGTTGTSGSSGESGTSGSSGISGTTGTSGSSGANGIDSSKPIQLSNITLLSGASWTFNSESSLYEYSYLNSAITINTIVDIIPSITSSAIVELAEIYAMTTSADGYVTIFSKNNPTGDIIVTINIFYI
jgi:hypothetical protein